jgi:beta-glucosidase-like glycosyl hydrolase
MTAAFHLSRPANLREKIAQLMFVRVGSNLPPIRTVEEDAQRFRQMLASCPVGGLLLFNGRREATPDTLASLQSASSQPLLVAADIERGVGQQLLGHAQFPHAMGFESLGGDADQAVHRFAHLTAAIARANGIHITLAPVADVNVDPRNPIIATRAFGSDPDRVASLVSAFVKGTRSGGLLSTAKHFPGHGNTHEDSHHTLPTVSASREEMESCELTPFRAAIAIDVPLVMTAHVRYPHLDKSGKCATLSHPILTELLREQLGFRGAVVSDSLLMDGVKSQTASEGELAVEALLAGVDILLDVADPVSALAAMEQAVCSGDLPEQRVEEAFERLWRLKEAVFVGHSPMLADSTIGTEDEMSEVLRQADEHALSVATRSITCLSGDKSLLPFAKEKSFCTVLVRPHTSQVEPVEQPLGASLRHQFPECAYYEITPNSDSGAIADVVQAASTAEQLLIALIVKPSAWRRFGLLDDQSALVKQLTQGRKCVLASLGTPESLQEFGDATLSLCTYSDVPNSQVALARYLVMPR